MLLDEQQASGLKREFIFILCRVRKLRNIFDGVCVMYMKSLAE
jgi:hypothetical protein